MYDVVLAERVRDLLADDATVHERPMFGGLAFFVGEHMAVVVSGTGGLMVRTDPQRAEALMASSKAKPTIMGGREMPGWLRVAAPDVRTAAALRTWVRRGVDFARGLPPKPPKAPRPPKRPKRPPQH